MTQTRINILPEIVANQIAAGEVIERPAAVLKELLENSLDAGATRIEIEVARGGRKLVQVKDNAAGMWPDDVLLALERHATSKIAVAEDLTRISSLGFRGEALPSMASVARLTIMSRPPEAETGFRVVVNGGRIQKTGETAMDFGTIVSVADLFFNVPARRKFLRQPSTELGHLQTAFIRQALARADVHLRLSADGRRLHLLPDQTPAQRVAALLGPELVRRGARVDLDHGPLRVTGFIGPPTLTRPSGGEVYTFLGGRFIRDRLVNHALFGVFRGLLPRGRFPVAVLWLEMDPALVDVNVHPTKAEVRFRRPDQVYEAVQTIVARALGLAGPASPDAGSPPAAAFSGEASPGPPASGVVSEPPVGAAASDQRADGPSTVGDRPPGPTSRPWWSAPRRSPFEGLAVIGQLKAAYILAEGPEGLAVIDQHAAYERLNFERLKQDYRAAEPARQLLLVPETVELAPPLARLVLDRAAWFGRLGLTLEGFGGATIMVKAVPAALSGADPADLIRRLADVLSELDAAPGTDEFFHEILAEMACQTSVRAGRRLSLEEMQALVDDLAGRGVAPSCPHGRPFLWEIDLDEVAKAFKR
ncbi:MAG: DNA mismatch repair endonuclease MutL [Proteobacteria bacterium]|nr:DNA mismatch repair endonuclease MutL [Pseudomonadota bacterium]MBU1743086.1 DNA mismatch repair endonuclease MutL [Pseudomonadota bacterium]